MLRRDLRSSCLCGKDFTNSAIPQPSDEAFYNGECLLFFSFKIQFVYAPEIQPNIYYLDTGVCPAFWWRIYNSFPSSTLIPFAIMHQDLPLTHLGSWPVNLQRQENLETKKFLECHKGMLPAATCPADFALQGCCLDQGMGKRHGVVGQAHCTLPVPLIAGPFTFCKKMLCS